MCDGVKTCRNGSDEDPDFCSSWECGEDRLKCPDDIQCAAKTDLCVKVRHAVSIVVTSSASSFEATAMTILLLNEHNVIIEIRLPGN